MFSCGFRDFYSPLKMIDFGVSTTQPSPASSFAVFGARRVQDGDNHNAGVGEYGFPHARQPEGAEQQEYRFDAQRERDILHRDMPGKLRSVDGFGMCLGLL